MISHSTFLFYPPLPPPSFDDLGTCFSENPRIYGSPMPVLIHVEHVHPFATCMRSLTRRRSPRDPYSIISVIMTNGVYQRTVLNLSLSLSRAHRQNAARPVLAFCILLIALDYAFSPGENPRLDERRWHVGAGGRGREEKNLTFICRHCRCRCADPRTSHGVMVPR